MRPKHNCGRGTAASPLQLIKTETLCKDHPNRIWITGYLGTKGRGTVWQAYSVTFHHLDELHSLSTGGLLCPIDSRRSFAEFVSKFIVVHLTTITAFCHLLSIRNEKILTWRPFFYFLTPFNILVQHALAGLAIFTNYVLFLCFPKSKVVSTPDLRTSFS
jgi:hypothetical protein